MRYSHSFSCNTYAEYLLEASALAEKMIGAADSPSPVLGAAGVVCLF